VRFRGGDARPLRRFPGPGVTVVATLLLAPLACETPPEYPADATHLEATEPRQCHSCHTDPDTHPQIHHSHLDEAGEVVEEHQLCHNCHQAVGAKTSFQR